jgi:hypothetical protein
MRTQYPTIPLSHEYVRAIHEAVRDTHISMSLLGMFEFFEEFEITRRDYYLAGG